ncbi:hypothetical protein [Streptomyces sp. NPDC048650]|uniref:hypothetical protein n=1 Tax=unclassified Streptomyces TaxID=2593676 RepID=UPI003710CDA4
MAAALVLPTLVRVWSQGRGGQTTLVAPLVSFVGLALVLALVRAARRESGVLVTQSWSLRLRRSRVVLPVVFVAGLLAGALCRVGGAGEAATRFAAFTVWGLGVWGACTARNSAIRRTLRERT